MRKLDKEAIELTQDEKVLLAMMAKFHETIKISAEQYAPTEIAKYVL